MKLGIKFCCLFLFILLLGACKKKNDGSIIVTTKPITDITFDGAKCGGSVTNTGNFKIGDCGICVSKNQYPTIEDYYTIDGHGSGSFVSIIDKLDSNTKYYVRAYANTSSGIEYGEQLHFLTKDGGWLYYGNDTYSSSYGIVGGGVFTWAVMFPPSLLSSFSGKKITKIKLYIREKGNYTFKIYKGGSTSPSTLLYSTDHNFSVTGRQTVEISPAVNLNASQNLWVSVTYIYDKDKYPATYSIGINNPNARWRKTNNSNWFNSNTNGWKDVCWMIQVCLSSTKSNDNDIYISYDTIKDSFDNDDILLYKNDMYDDVEGVVAP